MYKILIYNLFLIIFLFSIGCSNSKTDDKENPDLKNHAPYFWKVEKNNKASYFLGTIHFGLTFDNLPCSDNIKSYLEKSDYFLTEVPDDEEGNNNDVADDNNNNNKNKSDDSLSYFSSSQIGSSHIGSSPFGSSHIAYFEDEKQRNNEDIDNKELDNKGNTPLPPPPNARDNPGNQHLSKENGREFKSLSEESKVFLRSRGIPENLNYLAYLINIENLCKKSAIYRAGSEQVFLDWYVKAIAQSKSIPIEYLDEGVDQERVDMALALSWFSLGLVVDNHLIDEQILQFENCVSNHLKRFNEYKTSTLPYESGFTPEQYQIILLDRNLVWLDKFKKAHQNYNHIFLAGGAGHFIWKFNMLDMLRKEDFSVQRMNSSCSF